MSLQACDTYDNVNEVIFEQMAQAAAYTLGVSNPLSLLMHTGDMKIVVI